jgi:two-component system nitrate/nitrite response regulator NarL
MDDNYNNQTIKVLVVDDHPLVRKGIILCLAHRKNMEVVAEVGDAREVLAKAHELQPHVVLMDVLMPQMSGLTATSQLQKELPDIKVLMLSISENLDDLRAAMDAGARGYVLKGTSAEELGRAVESVHQGHMYFSPEIMSATLNQTARADQSGPKPRLTVREREVLVLVAEGRSNKETAVELGVSVRTVETHREHLMRKLDIHSAAALTRFAVANGFVPAQLVEA